jgi:hypothetical protein
LFAAMEAQFGRGDGGFFLKEVQEERVRREEVVDEGVQKRLWEESEKVIEKLEKEGAMRRAREKKEAEATEKRKDKEALKEEKKTGVDGARQRKGK